MRSKLAPRGSVLLAEQIYRLVNRTRRLLWGTAVRALEGEGESAFTWQVLCVLDRHGPQTQRDLAYLIAQHPAGASRLLDELERDGLIERHADPKDRRKLRVHNTAKGTAKLAACTPVIMNQVDGALLRLSPSERHALRSLLEQVLGEGETTEQPQPLVPEARTSRTQPKTTRRSRGRRDDASSSRARA